MSRVYRCEFCFARFGSSEALTAHQIECDAMNRCPLCGHDSYEGDGHEPGCGARIGDA